jgi:hypothetical protein
MLNGTVCADSVNSDRQNVQFNFAAVPHHIKAITEQKVKECARASFVSGHVQTGLRQYTEDVTGQRWN